MNNNIHIIWLGILYLVFPLNASALPIKALPRNDSLVSINIPNSYKRLINPLLDRDYHSLRRKVRGAHMRYLSKVNFIELFYEGIEEATLLFSEEYYSKDARKKFKKGLKRIITTHDEASGQHSIEGYYRDRANQELGMEWPNVEKSVFEIFSGEWHGNWRDEQVDHYWLPTHELPDPSFENVEISILAFQSVYTGDGIGWNYLVEKAGIQFLLGFVVHFDDVGRIYLARPHFGVPQQNGSIVWKTKDHMYLEFVCQKHTCDIHQEHYVITGISFKERKKNLKLMEAFQAIYTRDSILRPNWISLYKK